ncbi:alpha/beta hydrolase [Capnocytophaga sp. HP1101]
MQKNIITLVIACMTLMYTANAQTTENLTLEGSKGKLAATLQMPKIEKGKKVRMVIICHGFKADRERSLLRAIADELQQAGIASIRFDFNGCGESEGRFEDMTVLNEIEDAKKVIAYAQQLPWVSGISLVGHSQGGVVASMVAGELKKTIKSLVLCAPAAVLRDDALRGNTQGAIYDPHNIPEYVDLIQGYRMGRDYVATAQTLPIYETARQYKGAALVIHGTYDVVVPYTYGERYHQGYKNSQLILLPKVDHGFRGAEATTAKEVTAFIKKH